MFQGSIVALITPFKEGEVDYEALGNLIEFHVDNGTDAILVCGTTGESPTLTFEEHEKVIEFAVKRAAGRIKVIAGTGGNATHEAVHLTAHAKEVGADGALVVVPYYNKPTQRGLYEHFKTVAQEVDIPIIIYNIPSRTCVEISVDTMFKLASECENIVASKESTPNMDRISEIVKRLGESFSVLSGDDSLTLPMMALGAKGVISVANNVMPREVKELIRAALEGDFRRAREIHYYLHDLFKVLFIETNPIPVKTACWMLGMCEKEFRLPLTEMSPENENKLREVLKKYNLPLKN
ncbi:4-hydroxy-tetrahydrodipicolinate synthase [Aquifex aeolicus]|uniref:4-hydroxy-tetrahydrodipicolinate synthase n=1 Tax=Aquifex aeolicus (strain VF5) TaxID=224324 RepID=DAPA_AQUAE|nr:4-hydroxy-tetrahydrodipicolinate synthase [Aquifex aeolicus]O67216.1 RecName: Full=4-hydroxy-tetrahydrodipicolinate synthase; Short=HTPA synthase [Aquifex aeolicus VF5]2EHH_A Chain A, Dihydrodipicolinate synthase [Aquifex aeolicus]2EHH_C Chain C, Dihydrodipicolinate synthase [Aquifex aeolicus]2EHH_D Chain D, Dihydrodipicolinate synthase [Aquifex aeolicus]2EHH_E Chain E, Dihydrodipicolinate synthase [Aquifex aeolicus]AAC07169.1 dihydrodipicolinate synthase [Aquifex aeolicus VF5]